MRSKWLSGKWHSGLAAILAGALALSGCGADDTGGRRAALTPETTPVRGASEQREGDQAHPKIVAQFGGVYENGRVSSYVNQIGQRIARVSEQPNARWTFTVLDTPTVNAFAIPGGYVYVTRGLVALAGDEAQLAGVIGHEIGHVTAGHSSLREERTTIANLGLLAGAIGLSVLGVDPNAAGALMQAGQVAAGGYLAQYSRSDELDADNLGIRYLVRAGYDPYAQAEFLDRMAASSELQARIAGKGYDANRVDFFASHPANGPRTRQAIQVAEASGAVAARGAGRNQERFMAAIDGMVYGDSAAQGFVNGRNFDHPKLRFGFVVPAGFTINNTAKAVVATGPRNSRFIFDGAPDQVGSLTNYIAGVWAPGIARNVRTGQLSGLRAERINGIEAAVAVLPVELNNQVYEALLVAYRMDGKLYRVTGLTPRGSGLMPALTDSAWSFHRLSAAELSRLQEKRIHVVTVRAGDTVESLARQMNVDSHAVELFRVLNGLSGGQPLRAGERVKVVR